MIEKPQLKEAQKEWFVNAYKEILNELPEIDREKYKNEAILWIVDIPHFTLNSHQRLPIKLKHKLLALKNRLDGRSFD